MASPPTRCCALVTWARTGPWFATPCLQSKTSPWAQTGATRLIRGSQTWPRSRQPTEEAETERPPAGLIAFLDGQMYPAACANTSADGKRRRTLCLNYTPDWCRPNGNHFLSIGRETILGMPAELSGDLGYSRLQRVHAEPWDAR